MLRTVGKPKSLYQKYVYLNLPRRGCTFARSTTNLYYHQLFAVRINRKNFNSTSDVLDFWISVNVSNQIFILEISKDIQTEWMYFQSESNHTGVTGDPVPLVKMIPSCHFDASAFKNYFTLQLVLLYEDSS